MIIDDLLKKLDNNNRLSYYAFETFILNLLKVHQEKENKPFFSEPHRLGFDAYAPEGIEDIDGPTQIEIKINLEHATIANNLANFLKHKSRSEDKSFQNLLLISPYPISKKTRSRYGYIAKSDHSLARLILWGPEELNKIVFKNRKEANEIAENLFSLRIESAVKQKKDWKDDQKEKIDLLKKLYTKGQFSLFLGAGVSKSAGMADWNTLLNSLFVSYLANEFDNQSKITKTDIKQIVERLNDIDDPSALMVARYLRRGLDKSASESKEFTKTVTKNLYSLRDTEKPIDSKLIKRISEMCMPLRSGAKVKSVVSYNFDDLLERQLEKQSVQYHSIYTDNDFIDPDELPIYHVHGFLPEDEKNYNSLDQSTLVFSEEGYHQIYSESYHWSNLVQLTNLRENHCLMIGLSMTDPNLRRLLDISSRNTDVPRHFAFMQRMNTDDFVTFKNERVIKNFQAAEIFLNGHHNLNEEIMRELGVSIIWYDDHDDIPELLKKVMNS